MISFQSTSLFLDNSKWNKIYLAAIDQRGGLYGRILTKVRLQTECCEVCTHNQGQGYPIQVKGVHFYRNCGAASVGVLQDNLVLSTELIM